LTLFSGDYLLWILRRWCSQMLDPCTLSSAAGARTSPMLGFQGSSLPGIAAQTARAVVLRARPLCGKHGRPRLPEAMLLKLRSSSQPTRRLPSSCADLSCLSSSTDRRPMPVPRRRATSTLAASRSPSSSLVLLWCSLVLSWSSVFC